MRTFVPGIITAEQARQLASRPGEYLEFTDDIVSGIVEFISDAVSIKTSAPSYVRTERRVEGHQWHVDSAKHMPWCDWAASILLTPPEFDGGVLTYEDGFVEPAMHYLGMAMHSGDMRHRVTRHSGADRTVLLMFFAGGSADG